MIHVHFGACGKFKLEAHQVDSSGCELPGTRRVVADWFDNIITNAGLDRLATGGVPAVCGVGAGSTTPTATDVNLASPVARTNNRLTYTGAAATTAPYFSSYTQSFQFAQGAAAGNLTEVGMFVSTSGGVMFSRALILDGGGSPTTVTVLSNEILTVTYQFRLYFDVSDKISTVTVDTVVHTLTTRISRVTAGNRAQNLSSYGGFMLAGNGNIDLLRAFTGSIGTPEGEPSGTNLGSVAYPSWDSYVAGSKQINGTWTVPLAQFNGTIAAVQRFGSSSGVIDLQTGIAPAIVKDNTMTMTFSYRITWDRYTP